MTDKIIALQHEGAWFYWLPEVRHWGGKAFRWAATAGPVQEDLRPHGRRGWWTGTFEAITLTAIQPQMDRVIGYRLKDPAAVSELFPWELSPERWTEVGDREVYHSLYEAITEPVEDVITVHEGPWLRADGPPPPEDGRTWTAQLPYDLAQHRELLHLFPGHLNGFRAAVAERLKEIPGVTNVFTSGGPVSVYAVVPYEPARTRWQGAILRNGERSKKRGGQIQERLTRHEEFRISDTVAGADRTDAARRWDASMAAWVALVTEMATARPCGTCGGNGLASWRAER